jgi:protein TonB
MLLNLWLALALGGSSEPTAVRWISPADYPAALMAEGKEGVVDFRLTFNADGRVTACAIHQSSGVTLLDVITCRISARRARANEGQPRVQHFRHSWKVPAARD